MTEFGLHHKSDIAEQLAWRDKKIAALELELRTAGGVETQATGMVTERVGGSLITSSFPVGRMVKILRDHARADALLWDAVGKVLNELSDEERDAVLEGVKGYPDRIAGYYEELKPYKDLVEKLYAVLATAPR